jgi:hypothetical protein
MFERKPASPELRMKARNNFVLSIISLSLSTMPINFVNYVSTIILDQASNRVLTTVEKIVFTAATVIDAVVLLPVIYYFVSAIIDDINSKK